MKAILTLWLLAAATVCLSVGLWLLRWELAMVAAWVLVRVLVYSLASARAVWLLSLYSLRLVLLSAYLLLLVLVSVFVLGVLLLLGKGEELRQLMDEDTEAGYIREVAFQNR